MPAQATRPRWRAASEELARRDAVFAELHEQHGVPRLGPGAAPTARFEALASSIAYQQLAGRAAATIWGRVLEAVGDPFTPEAVLTTGPVRLRGAGLSGAKVAALTDLAAKAVDGTIRLERIARLDDDQVIDHLTAVRGIGPWTAQMFLLFDLRRLDVWPTGDYGVRNGFALAHRLDELPTEREMAELGDDAAPYRSVLAWWCWRATDTVTPGGGRSTP